MLAGTKAAVKCEIYSNNFMLIENPSSKEVAEEGFGLFFEGKKKKIGLRVIECAVSHISGSGKYAYSLGTSRSLSALPKEPCGEISGEGFRGFFPECSEFSDLKGKRGKSLHSTAGELNVSGLLIILYVMP